MVPRTVFAAAYPPARTLVVRLYPLQFCRFFVGFQNNGCGLSALLAEQRIGRWRRRQRLLLLRQLAQIEVQLLALEDVSVSTS